MKTSYMNPYLAGFFLGLVLLATIFITGHGLGASGALKSVVVATVKAVAPGHPAGNEFYHSTPGTSPLKAWLVFEILGVVLGAFVSGVISNRLTFETEHGPRIAGRTRLGMALIGGALFGIGAQFARGCTSGAALSGMAVLSFGGILTMFAIFGAAYGVAYFFRKLWN
ncbi:MAG TPA: YeeE/YedE thiosulfate transporter family protein [Bacteroidota bacterium]|nr:YeeE/YedE thiosulfate transporter family protein [Bacteroidota bacterium]